MKNKRYRRVDGNVKLALTGEISLTTKVVKDKSKYCRKIKHKKDRNVCDY